jgi:phosphohistidine phosphatase
VIELYLLRHADAGDPDRWAGDDADRPLSSKGLRQAGRLASHLRALGWKPDAIITSPKRRAAETADIVADAIGMKTKVDGRLATGFGVGELRELATTNPRAERLVLVGHDPDFSDVASLLAGTAIQLRKGSLIRIDLDEALASGVVRWLLPPDAVPES